MYNHIIKVRRLYIIQNLEEHVLPVQQHRHAIDCPRPAVLRRVGRALPGDWAKWKQAEASIMN